MSPEQQEAENKTYQQRVAQLKSGQQWGAILLDNYLIPKAAVDGDASFSWQTQQKKLTLFPTDTIFAKRLRHGRPQTNGVKVYGENQAYYAVPLQYGIDTFGWPSDDRRFQGEPLPASVSWKAPPLWQVGEGNYDQQPVADAIVRHVERSQRGAVVEVPTASGKTVIVEWVTQRIGMQTIDVYVRCSSWSCC